MTMMTSPRRQNWRRTSCTGDSTSWATWRNSWPRGCGNDQHRWKGVSDMEQRRADSPADSLMRFLNALVTRSGPRSIEELRESVHTMGMDPDRLVSRARERLAQAHEEARLSWVARAQAALPEI